jgi:hypothetical protein
MPIPHSLFTSFATSDGRVFAAGGDNICFAPDIGYVCMPRYTEVDVYDPANNTWSPAGNLLRLRDAFPGVVLLDGTLLISGGLGYTADTGTPLMPMRLSEIYTPTRP